MAILASVLNPQTYKVAAVTVANGGDNIGIYVPLFASSDLTSLGWLTDKTREEEQSAVI